MWDSVWWIVWAILWVAIAFWPARVAARKGHSFFLYFLFSLVFFPAALIVAYMVHDRRAAYADVVGSTRPAFSSPVDVRRRGEQRRRIDSPA